MSKDTSIFYLRWIEDYDDLPDEQFGRAIRAAYGLGDPPTDPLAAQAYKAIANQLRRDGEKYEEVCAARARGGSLGGRPRKDKVTENLKDTQNLKVSEKHNLSKNPDMICSEVMCSEVMCSEVNETNKNIPPTSPQGEVPGGTSAKSSHFVAPSVEQVRDFMAAFCAKQGYALEENLADRFWDFYESKGWKVGRSPMKSWECTARNWCRDHGKADTNIVNGITLGYEEHIDAHGQRYYISAKGKTIYIPADKRPRRKGEIWNAETNDWGFYD